MILRREGNKDRNSTAVTAGLKTVTRNRDVGFSYFVQRRSALFYVPTSTRSGVNVRSGMLVRTRR
jgi:hypothetical protein